MRKTLPHVTTPREAAFLEAARMIYNKGAGAYRQASRVVGEETAMAMLVMFLTTFDHQNAPFPMPEGTNAWVYTMIATRK